MFVGIEVCGYIGLIIGWHFYSFELKFYVELIFMVCINKFVIDGSGNSKSFSFSFFFNLCRR